MADGGYLVQLDELRVRPGHLDGDPHDVLLLRHDGRYALHDSQPGGETETVQHDETRRHRPIHTPQHTWCDG